MNTDDTGTLEQSRLEQWLETTRLYLFANTGSPVDRAGNGPPEPKLDQHGAQDRFVARVRGQLLRFAKSAASNDGDPLQELERTFLSQVAYIAQYPDIPRRLLGWSAQGGNTRIRRRIQIIIALYEARLARMIDRAKHQGLVRAGIESHIAAHVFVGLIQSLALRMNAGLRQRELLLTETADVFALYRAGMAASSK